MGLTPFVDLYPKRKEKQDFSGLYSKLLGLPLEGAIAFYPKTQIICYIVVLKVLKEYSIFAVDVLSGMLSPPILAGREAIFLI